MAIRIIEGVPGSGKSYYAVRHLAKTYFKKDAEGVYQLDKPCILITNINSFKPDHVDLDSEIRKAGGVEVFFSLDYQRDYKDIYENKIVYVVDEAQMKFRKGVRNLADVYSYFEYHRHWGQDIYLVTQNTKKLPPDIVLLVENIIVAAPRIRSIAGEFKYKWMDGNTVMKREAFKPSKAVFALYKSMEAEETEKIKNPMMKTVALALFASAVILISGYWFFQTRWASAGEKQKEENQSKMDQQNDIVPVSGQRIAADPFPISSLLVHFIPLNTIEEFTPKGIKVLFIWQNDIFTMNSFPYPTVMIGGQWYAQLDADVYSFIFNEDNPPVGQIIQKKV